MEKNVATRTRSSSTLPVHGPVAVWIDRRLARIIRIKPDGHCSETKILPELSGLKDSNGNHAPSPYAGFSMAAEKKNELQKSELKKKFFRKIRRNLSEADRILVVGPGPVKYELDRELRRYEKLRKKMEVRPLAVNRLSSDMLRSVILRYFQNKREG